MTDPEGWGLPAEVRDFLVELSTALRKMGLYPPEHPSLAPLADRIHDGLAGLLARRERLSLSVSPDVLVTEEGESDPDHPALRELARRLHDHELARVTFHALVDREQVAGFLRAVSARPDGEEGPLGARRHAGDGWPHVDLEPASYERLALAREPEPRRGRAGEAPSGADGEEAEGEAAELWLGLARAALSDEAPEGEEGEGPPEVSRVVVALERYSADEARARKVASRLLELARRLGPDGPDAAPEGRRRLERLLEGTDPDAVGRIFAAAPPETGRAFLEAAGDWMPVETMLRTVEGASGDERLGVSYHMLRLLARLADLVHAGDGPRDPEAERAFREQIRSLVTGWGGDVEAPEGEELPLPGPGGPGVGHLAAGPRLVEPERLVKTALELDRAGPVSARAVDEMLEADRAVPLLELLREAPPGEVARPAVWRRVATVETLGRLLRRDPPDFRALDEVLDHLGTEAAGRLLDALSESGSRSFRRRIFSRLAELEGDVDGEILRRLGDERWYVKRNMLALLAERGELPEGFSALPHTTHERAAVRREAYRLALRDPEEREEAVRRGMEDDDPRVLSLVFGTLEGLPDGVLDDLAPALVRKVEDEALSPDLRRPGVRALARVGDPAALELLLSLCRTRSPWSLWRTRLVEKGPLMLDALRALARGWADHPRARRVLERAREASDDEVRRAAAGEPPSPEAA